MAWSLYQASDVVLCLDTKFGMFLHDSETNTVWFSQVQGNDREYFLVGLVLGLAIYNGVILDVHFPLVVYKKLVGQPVRARLLQRSHSFLCLRVHSLTRPY